MQKAGKAVNPADWPPKLEWEQPVWDLFERHLTRQWRTGFGGRSGLDFNVAIALAGRNGWDVDLALELLGAVEGEILDWDDSERKKRSQD